MKGVRNICVGLFVLAAPVVRADLATEISNAVAPMEEGVPEVTVARLQALLRSNLSDQDRRDVLEKLAETWIVAHQPAEALKVLDDPALRDVSSKDFLRAQALASLQRWKEALALYERVAGKNSPNGATAMFGAGEMLRVLGQREEALKKFAALFRDQQWGVEAQLRSVEIYLDKSDPVNAKRILDKLQPQAQQDKKARHLLRGRLELALHRPERAIPIFETLLKRSENADHSVVTAALFAIADAHLQAKTPEGGDDRLEEFIEHHPNDVDIARLFSKLDEVYQAQRKPSRSELERWVRDPAQPRRGLARWYLARLDLRAGHRDRALQGFADLRRDGAKFSELAPALVEFANLEIEDRRFEEAIAILEEARPLRPNPEVLEQINLAAARANYFARRFDEATAMYEQIADKSPPLKKVALFNAAAGALQMDDHARFVTDSAEFEKAGGGEDARAELRLEEGLTQASKSDKNAAQTLQGFLRDFPQNPRASEAWVALAELAFHAAPPRLEEARRNLAKAMETKPTAAATERGDYLNIWIEDSTEGSDTKVIEMANRFIQQHPESVFLSDVRMKLAETYYRRQDFPNAQTQFEILAEKNPASALNEKALFFAAESAMSSMGTNSLDRAIVLFDRVVQLNGELKWAARNEQAVIERKLGKPQDALSLYDEVLKGDARPAEKREALCGKGDIFFEMGGRENYLRAIQTYDQLAMERDIPIYWRNQALFKKGLCLEKASDRSGALTTFYQVLEDEARPDRRRELFWFYKAGFNAARLLEDEAKWESAVAIYQKMAAVGGSRSEEAKTRLNRLRLEHFLWGN